MPLKASEDRRSASHRSSTEFAEKPQDQQQSETTTIKPLIDFWWCDITCEERQPRPAHARELVLNTAANLLNKLKGQMHKKAHKAAELLREVIS